MLGLPTGTSPQACWNPPSTCCSSCRSFWRRPLTPKSPIGDLASSCHQRVCIISHTPSQSDTTSCQHPRPHCSDSSLLLCPGGHWPHLTLCLLSLSSLLSLTHSVLSQHKATAVPLGCRSEYSDLGIQSGSTGLMGTPGQQAGSGSTFWGPAWGLGMAPGSQGSSHLWHIHTGCGQVCPKGNKTY